MDVENSDDYHFIQTFFSAEKIGDSLFVFVNPMLIFAIKKPKVMQYCGKRSISVTEFRLHEHHNC